MVVVKIERYSIGISLISVGDLYTMQRALLCIY
jgi:hypothetical protein